MTNDKILITGGSGLLGTYFRKLNPNIIAPTQEEMDILDIDAIMKCIEHHQPTVLIHCAAYVNPVNCAANPVNAIRTNIIGTCNIVEACFKYNCRLVYLESDYVYKGDKGNYKETDAVLPQNTYAKSKYGGECAVQIYPNSLILRTAFYPDVFPYDKAYVDKYASADYLSILAPIMLDLAIRHDVKGIINVGTNRKTIKELAMRTKPDVGDLHRHDMKVDIPKDSSFDISRLESIYGKFYT